MDSRNGTRNGTRVSIYSQAYFTLLSALIGSGKEVPKESLIMIGTRVHDRFYISPTFSWRACFHTPYLFYEIYATIKPKNIIVSMHVKIRL